MLSQQLKAFDFVRNISKRPRFCSYKALYGYEYQTFYRHFTSSPWFVDPEPQVFEDDSKMSLSRHQAQAPDLPQDLPGHLVLLYTNLSTTPLLAPGMLEIKTEITTATAPPLPVSLPKGRRRRGGTDAGLGFLEPPGGVWKWILIAQVKEGTENRGSIQSVIRIVRKTLLKASPPLALPPNRKRIVTDGWALIDAGDFVVNILSRSAREKFFPDGPRNWE